jgi:hypothetical protein
MDCATIKSELLRERTPQPMLDPKWWFIQVTGD